MDNKKSLIQKYLGLNSLFKGVVIGAVIVLILVFGAMCSVVSYKFGNFKAVQHEHHVDSSINVNDIKKIGEFNTLSIKFEDIIKVDSKAKIIFGIETGEALDIIDVPGTMKIGYDFSQLSIKKHFAHTYKVKLPETKVNSLEIRNQKIIFQGKNGFLASNSKQDLFNRVNKDFNEDSSYKKELLKDNKDTAEENAKNYISNFIKSIDKEADVKFA
jgi:hypothetical protein